MPRKIIETKKTYRGVYNNIADSNICCVFSGIYLYFCSESAKNRFESGFESYKEKAVKRIQAIFPDVGIENIDLALGLTFYKIIEKRGFRAETFAGVPIKKAHLIGDVEFNVKEE